MSEEKQKKSEVPFNRTPLTKEALIDINKHLVEAWNIFNGIMEFNPLVKADFINNIHNCQGILAVYRLKMEGMDLDK